MKRGTTHVSLFVDFVIQHRLSSRPILQKQEQILPLRLLFDCLMEREGEDVIRKPNREQLIKITISKSSGAPLCRSLATLPTMSQKLYRSARWLSSMHSV